MTQQLFPDRKKQLELTQMTHKIYVYHHSCQSFHCCPFKQEYV